MSYPKITLRSFIERSDGALVYQWMNDESYWEYFRSYPTRLSAEDCMNFPKVAQNIVLMIQSDDGRTIGMCTAHNINWINRTCTVGILIDKEYQKKKYSHVGICEFVKSLWKQYNIRKIYCEVLSDVLLEPMQNIGFIMNGTFPNKIWDGKEYKDEFVLCLDREDYRGN